MRGAFLLGTAFVLVLGLSACESLLPPADNKIPRYDTLACRWNEVGVVRNTSPDGTAPDAASPSNASPSNASPDPSIPTPTAGQMTEAAAQAKRLFDSERWSEAMTALARVIDGSTGDDQGNREIARYHLAVTYVRLDRPSDALKLFAQIAAAPWHPKFAESELWLGKLAAISLTTEGAIDALAAYSDTNTQRFNNPQQRDHYRLLQYATARAELRRGNRALARARFQAIPADSPYALLASDCLRFVPDTPEAH